ncbi:unnamed protein product [Phaedon cochleariae]|uniref:BTB domain-containing protein n=1 Tax=Phaedon cochleariae TaxID=80249 RepID=A0A9P0DI03_PHACE|nr:unnamed protein product [Phaedon cochleariae]
MVDPNFEQALIGLGKKQDSKTVLKILVHIRREVEWPKNIENITKLREKGCLKHLVGILQMPQKHILDVCLSILGNCIMDKGCARETIGTYNILSPLNHLLRHFPKEDSINGRIFRILGNMCHHRDQWANIILDRKPHIVMHIVGFIKSYSKDDIPTEEKFSEASAIMAIRTLRLLLNSQTVMPLIKSYGVLKTVGSLLIKLSAGWQESKANEGVLNNIIRLLYDYSRYHCYNSILEMRNTERGDSLIHLFNVLLLSPKKIVKIIMNFIKISQLKSELPVPEICDKFIEEVMKKNYDTEEFKSECIEYIQCLCYLLEHPANRNIERCANCLPLLVKVLKSLDKATNVEIECSILLVKTLNNFKYEESLILEQLKCDVVQVVLSKLHWVVGNSETLKIGHKRVRKRKGSQAMLTDLEFYIEDSLDFEFSFYKSCNRCLLSPRSPPLSDDESALTAHRAYDRSPSPCSSVASNDARTWSPPPRLSPSPFSTPRPVSSPRPFSSPRLFASGGVADDSDSDDYSPVCSEADPGEEFALEEEEEEEEVSMVEEGEFEETEEVSAESPPYEASSTKSLKARLIVEISKLILTYSRIRPPLPELGKEDLLLALIKCSDYSSLQTSVTVINAICRILQSQVYLIPLMKTTFIENVYSMTSFQHPSCTKCVDHSCVGRLILRRITELAESAVGKGDIAHGLLRGSDEDKRKLVLTIPYIFTNKSILAKLMLNCGGLGVLMGLLKDDSSLKERTIKVLCALAAKRLEIANPKEVSIDAGSHSSTDLHPSSEESSCTVEFELDDGSRLQTNRAFLMEKSEFFRCLLDGSFRESGETVVRLRDVEMKSLRSLVELMKNEDRIQKTVRGLDTRTLLDVIALSDRFLLPRLCARLCDCVERHKMSVRTAPAIYRWSLESRLDLLRVESVAFALVARVSDKSRTAMFEGLFALGHDEELIGDIEGLLVRYLSRFRGVAV